LFFSSPGFGYGFLIWKEILNSGLKDKNMPLEKEEKEMSAKNKKRQKCKVIKHFDGWPDKVVYTGTLREAKRRIPVSKKDQFSIEFI